jgi:hypothetical protein
MILLLLIAGPISTALAFTAGPYNAGTGTNVGGAGTVDWVEPNGITSPGSPYAVATLNKDNRYSNYLQGANYSFNLPINATINGIEVVINHMSSGNNPSIYDNQVSLVKAGVIVGDNKASLVPWLKGSFSTTTYGSAIDLWGATWSAADINDANFGVALAVYRQNQGNNQRDAIVDSMKITVYFTLGAATTTVECGTGTPITYGDNITCKATVTDAGVVTPTGTVNWTTDGSGNFDFTQCTLNEVSVGISTCSVAYTPTFVGTGSHLITGNYSGDTNYSTSSGTDTVSVNKKPASATPNAASKTYGDADPVLTGTLTGFLAADGVTATWSRTAGETVLGSPYTISAALSPTEVLSNYDVTYSTANFTINLKAASVTPNAASKTYGDADPTLTGTLSGFLVADGVTATYSRTAGETVLGSPYTLSATLNPAEVLSNYDITYNTANFTINLKAASVTPNAASKTYGDADPTLTGTLTGFLVADGVTATYSRTAGETVLGSPYTINATLNPTAVLSNYDISYNTANLNITKRLITVTADAKVKAVGQSDPPLTYHVTSGSLAFSDTFSGALIREPGEAIGTYAILQGTLALNANYTLTYVDANLTITNLLFYFPILLK